MVKIVDMAAYRGARSFAAWKKRFHEDYGPKTRIRDLSDATIYRLAMPGEESNNAHYELILGILDFGKARKLSDLDRSSQMKVVDIHLTLADQVRFDLMRRLGWVTDVPSDGCSLVDIVRNAEQRKRFFRDHPPQLDQTHPRYSEYADLVGRDKEGFIRRLLVEALETFKKRIK